jgi:cytochrome P450
VSGAPPSSAPTPTRGETLAGASVARTMRALAHLPHCGHAPILADIRFLRDALGFAREVHARCGPVSRGVLFARPQVLLMSAQANERVLFDRDGAFSAHGGWGPLLGKLFPGGLIVRDGDDHRRHRRMMLPALRREELAKHTARMAPAIDAAVRDWIARGQIEMHHEVKRLTLSLAIDVFLGVKLRDEIDALDHDFNAIVDASAAIMRLPVPGTVWSRGLAARARAAAFLHAQIARRRHSPGEDLFSQLCVQAGPHAAHGDADPAGGFTDQELVDHMIFLLMAAHDTTTSALTTTVMSLALHDEWQARLRDEVHAQAPHRESAPAGHDPTQAPDIDELGRLELVWQTLREALRMYPPIPTIARATTREVEIHDQRIPAGTQVTVFPLLVQRDPQWWTDPDRFDPERFGPGRAEHKRHAFAWTPFGGGAHMCLGMNFAELQAKLVLRTMLARARWRIAPGYRHDYAFAPIGKPRHGLPIALQPL